MAIGAQLKSQEVLIESEISVRPKLRAGTRPARTRADTRQQFNPPRDTVHRPQMKLRNVEIWCTLLQLRRRTGRVGQYAEGRAGFGKVSEGPWWRGCISCAANGRGARFESCPRASLKRRLTVSESLHALAAAVQIN